MDSFIKEGKSSEPSIVCLLFSLFALRLLVSFDSIGNNFISTVLDLKVHFSNFAGLYFH